MPVKVKDLLPLIWYNDIRLVNGANEEICLLRKDFTERILSDKYLNMEVECVENDECILDTVNIHVKETGGDDDVQSPIR